MNVIIINIHYLLPISFRKGFCIYNTEILRRLHIPKTTDRLFTGANKLFISVAWMYFFKYLQTNPAELANSILMIRKKSFYPHAPA